MLSLRKNFIVLSLAANIQLGLFGAVIPEEKGTVSGLVRLGVINQSNDGSSFAYVGEAYIDYTANDLSIRIGRQLIDTLLVNTDEIRMHLDTYEAALATYSGVDKTTLTAGYIKRWAGYDSGADISKFKKVAQDSKEFYE